MRALLIANEHDADPGVVGERLEEAGVRLHVAARERPDRWPDLSGIDLVVSLGSDWSVYWPEVATSVKAEVALVRDVHRRRVPLLAICFGAQVVAHALGGTVGPSPIAEIGWYEVESESPTIDPGPWLQWHVDAFRVPPGFARLAHSPAGPQAMLGGHTLAVQFHPEITPAILDRWASGGADDLATAGVDPAALREQTERLAPASRDRAIRLVDTFLALTSDAPAGAR
jgi:GMP synthase-like glutamine amidotransferase